MLKSYKEIKYISSTFKIPEISEFSIPKYSELNIKGDERAPDKEPRYLYKLIPLFIFWHTSITLIYLHVMYLHGP